jgi:uncharacterized membrane protein
MNLVAYNGSLAALLDSWFFSLSISFYLLLTLMALIAIAAYGARQLSLSGALAAFLVGFSTTWILGFGALFTLLFFFIAAGVLGKLSKRIRGREMETMQAKGGAARCHAGLCQRPLRPHRGTALRPSPGAGIPGDVRRFGS